MPLRSTAAALAALFLAAAALAGAGEIRGRALAGAQPAAGVTVSVLPFEDGLAAAAREARGEALPKAVATATTRPDGTFAVALPAAAAGTAVRLSFGGGGVAPVVLDRLLDGGGEDAGDQRLPRAQPLAGRVTDERGGPVVGATVTLWPGRPRGLFETPRLSGVAQAATTKPDGTFRFDTAAEDGNRLRVEAPAMAAVEREGVPGGAIARPVVLLVGQVRRGTVTLPDRRTPAKGALVRFEGRTRTRWVETRPDGSFVLDGAPREAGALVADAGDRGRGATPVAATGTDPVAITLAATATLSGRVVDQATARAVPGVRIVARGPDGASFLARSGPDGRYALRGLPPQAYRLAAEDDRFVPFARSVTVAAGSPETQDVPLVRAAALAGRVVNEEGVPIEGALVTVSPSGENLFASFVRRLDGEAPTRTGKDGSFRATRLMPGEGQRVDVRHDDYAERSVAGLSLAAGATRSGFAIVMRRGLSLRGVAKDEDGRPLAGVEVTLSATRTMRAGRGGMQLSMIGPGSQVRRETGADGRFEFRGLKAGEYSLAARRPGRSRASLDPVKVAEGGTEPVALVLHPGATVTGLVHDRSGAGAPGWYVSARAAGQGGPAIGPDSIRTEEATGPDGFFVLEGLTGGESYDLQVMGTAGLGPRKAGVTAPSDGVDLTVSGTGQVRGRVVDAESGKAVPDFEVRYQPDAQGGMRFVMRVGPGRQGGPFERVAHHSDDGSFTVDDVPAGRWSVEAFASGYQSGSTAGVVVSEGEVAEGVEVRLSRGSVVAGRVLESRAGRPVLGATVRAELSGGAEGRMTVMRMGGEGRELEALTDADGRYEIAGLAPGSWTLTASHPEWSEATARVEIKDAPAAADIRMGRGGSVAGTVLAGGRPVGGAQVVLQAAGDSGFRMSPGMLGGAEQSALSDEGGRFRFERLTPGRYSAVASLRDETSAPAEAVVTGDEAQEVQLSLAEGARVRGVVSGLPDAQLANVSVSAQGGDFFASTRTSAGGAFELTGVPDGPLSLRATAGDFVIGSSRSATATVTIAPGQAEATAEIAFEGGFRVDGRVTRGGRPVADATVMANPEAGGGRGASAAGRTDESGAYVLEGVQEGRYTITAMSTDSAPIRQTVAIAGDTTVDLEAPPARLAGVVVEAESGRPLSEVSVRIEDGSAGTRFVTMATSDSSGRFAFEDLEPRAYRVAFQKPAYQADTRELVAAEGAETRVELRRGEGIGIEARDGIFATPLRGLFVRVVDSAGNAAFAGTVSLDGDGRGEVPALKPGSYELRAESSGYAPVRMPVAVPSRTIPLTLTPGGSLEIQVGPQTLALAEPFGRLLGGDGQPYLPNAFSADGRIGLGSPARRLENVAPGRYVLEVQGGARRDVTVTEGGRSAVTLP